MQIDYYLLACWLMAIGSLGAFIVEIWHRIIRPYFQKKKQKHITEMQTLTSLEDGLRRLKVQIDIDLSNLSTHGIYTRTNLTAYLSREQLPNFYEKLIRYDELMEDCINLRKIFEEIVNLKIWDTMRGDLSKTVQQLGLNAAISLKDNFVGMLTNPLIRGEKVNKSWLESEKTSELREIEKIILGPDDLNVFLRKLRVAIQKTPLFEMYEAKRDKLIQYAKQLKDDIDEESLKIKKDI